MKITFKTIILILNSQLVTQFIKTFTNDRKKFNQLQK